MRVTVRQILSRKEHQIPAITPSVTVAAALKLLAEQRSSAIIVLNESGNIVGIVAEHDVIRALDEKGPSTLDDPVTSIMIRKVVTCADTVSIMEAMERMMQGQFRHLPITRDGGLAGMISISDIVAVRLEELENSLINVETITASIAHEVRQPLAAITTNAGAAIRFFDRTPPDLKEIRAALVRIADDCHRTSEIFNGIRELFRATDRGKQPIDVNELIIGVLESLRADLINHGVTVQQQLASELPFPEGNSGQLQQVIYNLIQNAIEAMDAIADRDRVLRIKTEVRAPNSVALLMEDSGPGIDPKDLSRMFEAFVTTKPSGMGLGLALCRQIIERHAGHISVVSDGKNGTLFEVLLPVRN